MVRLVQADAEEISSDVHWVERAKAGDDAAMTELFNRHVRLANGLAFRLLASEADVDDVVQDSFAYALSHLDTLEKPAAFRSWVAGIIVRSSYKVLRRRRMLRRLGMARADPADLDAAVSPTASPEVVHQLRAIYSRIDDLPTDLRVPLLLRRVEGLTLPEIATMTQTSLATVKRRIASAEQVLGLEVAP
jgi:RNA polymerase sigma-70 factor (ECF subfamily)